jgi:biopolymer transport protein ExbD
MLASAQTISNTGMASPLGAASGLRRRGGKGKKSVAASLMLTSLVDAFSILVLFLMLNSSANQETVEYGKLTLPASASSAALKKATTVKIESGRYFVNNTEVSEANLVAQLESQKTNVDAEMADTVLIVADKEMDYVDLNPLVLKASEAGYKTFKFAVVKDR